MGYSRELRLAGTDQHGRRHEPVSGWPDRQLRLDHPADGTDIALKLGRIGKPLFQDGGERAAMIAPQIAMIPQRFLEFVGL